MSKNASIVRYRTEELDAMRRQGQSWTDWARVDAQSEEDLAPAIDRADEGEFDWSTAQIGIPGPKKQVTVRFDADVIEWFKAQGPGYQTRMNAVLRRYVEAQKRRGR